MKRTILTAFSSFLLCTAAFAHTNHPTTDQFSKSAPALNKKVLNMAITAYDKVDNKHLAKKPVLTVIDYSLPSNKKRMWIFDVKTAQLKFHTYVAHGQNSGALKATKFSNINGSKQTSLGTFITKNVYYGSKGMSLNLQGLEKGFNDKAYERRVVIHGAHYVNQSFINKVGRLGRSWGCPAVDQKLAKPIIQTIKDGSVVFAYYPDQKWLTKSKYVA